MGLHQYQGIVKEYGSSENKNGYRYYTYIEFDNGTIIQDVRIGLNLDGKFISGFQSQEIVTLILYDGLVIGLIIKENAYLSYFKGDLGDSFAIRMIAWISIIAGIATIPILLIGLLPIGWAVGTLFPQAKHIDLIKKIHAEQVKLKNQYPNAVLFEYS